MVKSIAPKGSFDASERTKKLRPRLSLSDRQVAKARKMRRAGLTNNQIAREFGVAEEEIKVLLAAMRTRIDQHKRYTLNIGVEACDFIKWERLPSEAIWETMDRLLTELQQYRNDDR
ncbi:hypothetical protein [Ferrovibrio sp.]|uniref:hypothetical protein n=1 Tax=Ferrovibrio sp. TaxID=1917215 RepID=UPI0025C56FF8|nr:hypothetical protein [Ferrovibrio sp.]MBX3454722.1 hypothetical protein [Ferrovibrio sp.]